MNVNKATGKIQINEALTNADSKNNVPARMSGEECLARFHQQRKATDNRAMRNFNRLDNDFKFVVMTLSNRLSPGAFRSEDIGKPFEYFDEERRKLIVSAMNRVSRWGNIMPKGFPSHEYIIPSS